MAITHCGFVPHQNKNINQRPGFLQNNSVDDSAPNHSQTAMLNLTKWVNDQHKFY